jgi:hypothetical protein
MARRGGTAGVPPGFGGPNGALGAAQADGGRG